MGNVHDRVHVARQAVDVDREDRFGARRDARFDQCWIDVVARRIDIDKDRNGALVENRLERPRKGEGGGDHFVTGLNTDRVERRVDGRRAGVEQNRVRYTQTIGPLTLQTGCLDPVDAGQLPAVQHGEHSSLVLRPNVWPAPLQVAWNSRSTPTNRQCVVHLVHPHKNR